MILLFFSLWPAKISTDLGETKTYCRGGAGFLPSTIAPELIWT